MTRESRRRFLALASGLAAAPVALASSGAPAPRAGLASAATPAVASDAVPRRGSSGKPAGSARVDWRDVPLLDGRVLPAAQLRGAPVVVEFWASWCPFCARQNPHLQALWDAERAHGLRVLTFSIDRDPAAARGYMARHGYTFPAAMQSAQTARWFGVRRGLPMLYVVDAEGRIALEEAGEMFPEDVAALARFAPGSGAAAAPRA